MNSVIGVVHCGGRTACSDVSNASQDRLYAPRDIFTAGQGGGTWEHVQMAFSVQICSNMTENKHPD